MPGKLHKCILYIYYTHTYIHIDPCVYIYLHKLCNRFPFKQVSLGIKWFIPYVQSCVFFCFFFIPFLMNSDSFRRASHGWTTMVELYWWWRQESLGIWSQKGKFQDYGSDHKRILKVWCLRINIYTVILYCVWFSWVQIQYCSFLPIFSPSSRFLRHFQCRLNY